MCVLLAGCGAEHARTPAAQRSTAPRPTSTVGASAPTVAPTATSTPGDFGTTVEGLTFAWAEGYTPPAWLPSFIRRAPPAPSGGSPVCGSDPGRALYTALIRYDPSSSAGAITVQVQGFRGAGSYTNSGGATPVDIEVSPPAPNLPGLSGFAVPGATVQVNDDLTSGTLASTLVSGTHQAGTISGSWRCA